MAILKRVLFFGLVNIAIMIMITFIIRVTGIEQILFQYLGSGYMSLFGICLIWGMGGAFISLSISKWMAKKFMGVHLVENMPEYQWVVQSVHHFARNAGLEVMPEVGVYDSPELNAFATGPSKKNSLVAVSTGLLNRMDRDQVEGVLAHEVAHIANGDMVTMTLIQGVINSFVYFVARIVAEIINNSMKDDNGRGGLGFFGYFIVVSVLQTVFGLLGMMVTSYFSRWREFRADYGASKLASKEKMISALKALQNAYPQLEEKKDQDDKVAAFQSLQISSKSRLFALISTHPPLEKRIKALQAAS